MEFKKNLVVVRMSRYDVMLGIDWMCPLHATIECYENKITLCSDDGFVVFVRNLNLSPFSFDFLDSFNHLPQAEGYHSFLSSIRGEEVIVNHSCNLPLVEDFLDVFPNELPSVAPHREVNLCIDVYSGTNPILIAPYRMAPLKMRELKS